ncbi:MAG: MarR family winged helix-turn-helix transcriptional regulator [Candidatus Dormibacteria bacterium]
MTGAPRTTQLAAAWLDAVRHLRRSLRHQARGHQPFQALSGAHRELTDLVEEAPGLTVSEAAGGLHLAPNTVSTLVSQLARLDLLERRNDPGDARLTRLWPTKAGVERRSVSRDLRVRALAGALDQLREVDRRRLAAALAPMRALVSEIESGVRPPRPGAKRPCR